MSFGYDMANAQVRWTAHIRLCMWMAFVSTYNLLVVMNSYYVRNVLKLPISRPCEYVLWVVISAFVANRWTICFKQEASLFRYHCLFIYLFYLLLAYFVSSKQKINKDSETKQANEPESRILSYETLIMKGKSHRKEILHYSLYIFPSFYFCLQDCNWELKNSITATKHERNKKRSPGHTLSTIGLFALNSKCLDSSQYWIMLFLHHHPM